MLIQDGVENTEQQEVYEKEGTAEAFKYSAAKKAQDAIYEIEKLIKDTPDEYAEKLKECHAKMEKILQEGCSGPEFY
jgi:hypothetical protein